MNTFVETILVEDNPHEAELTIRALKKNQLVQEVTHLRDGQEALEYLFSPAVGSPPPRLIFLDLKMPRVNGLEFLKVLKADERRKVIPVVMLTSSQEERDILESYKLGVNAYIVKPLDFDRFIEAVGEAAKFWLSINQAPSLAI